MKIDREEAMALKVAVKRIFDTLEGQLLIEYFEDAAGKYSPTYSPESQTSITLEAGRRQFLASLHNLNRLTAEQIVEYYSLKGSL